MFIYTWLVHVPVPVNQYKLNYNIILIVDNKILRVNHHEHIKAQVHGGDWMK